MTTYAEKTSEAKSQAVANSLPEKQSSDKSTSQFEDNRAEAFIQRKVQKIADNYVNQQLQPVQKRKSNTGLPDNLKSGIENLSGFSMDDVKVHYNSDKPAQLHAYAYAQGTEIHIASGQERHLPHEAWHVVQQKQGRVKPTLQLRGKVNVNNDLTLEKEADIMGSKATQTSSQVNNRIFQPKATGFYPAVQLAKTPSVNKVKKGTTVTKSKKGSPFSKVNKDKIIAANKKKNKGLITCEECAFSHHQQTYVQTDQGSIGDGGFHVDHITPNAHGGQGVVNNGRVLCGTCNTSRGAGNKIGVTGYSKWGTLDGQKKTHVIKLKDYNKKKEIWKDQWKPKNKGKKYAFLDLKTKN